MAHIKSLCKTEKDFYIPCEGAVVSGEVMVRVLVNHRQNTNNLTPDFEYRQTD